MQIFVCTEIIIHTCLYKRRLAWAKGVDGKKQKAGADREQQKSRPGAPNDAHQTVPPAKVRCHVPAGLCFPSPGLWRKGCVCPAYRLVLAKGQAALARLVVCS
jgi:hypothetical protein